MESKDIQHQNKTENFQFKHNNLECQNMAVSAEDSLKYQTENQVSSNISVQEGFWALVGKTPSPMKRSERSPTSSSFPPEPEESTGYIWSMYSGCQHTDSHFKLPCGVRQQGPQEKSQGEPIAGKAELSTREQWKRLVSALCANMRVERMVKKKCSAKYYHLDLGEFLHPLCK